MRGAHQGVPVAALPDSSGGGLFSGNSGRGAPTPPAPMQAVAANAPQRQTSASAGLDGWLLNNFFSRR